MVSFGDRMSNNKKKKNKNDKNDWQKNESPTLARINLGKIFLFKKFANYSWTKHMATFKVSPLLFFHPFITFVSFFCLCRKYNWIFFSACTVGSSWVFSFVLVKDYFKKFKNQRKTFFCLKTEKTILINLLNS